MSWLRKVLIGETDEKPATKPAERPTAPAPRTAGPTGSGGRDVFRFKEGLHVNSGGTANFGKHSPLAGTAVVELYNDQGQLMMLDTFKVSKPAPHGPFWPYGRDRTPATFHYSGKTNRSHQEFEFDTREPPLELPQHLLDKINIGAVKGKIWWSVHE